MFVNRRASSGAGTFACMASAADVRTRLGSGRDPQLDQNDLHRGQGTPLLTQPEHVLCGALFVVERHLQSFADGPVASFVSAIEPVQEQSEGLFPRLGGCCHGIEVDRRFLDRDGPCRTIDLPPQ
jgi:hypothetical protein